MSDFFNREYVKIPKASLNINVANALNSMGLQDAQYKVVGNTNKKLLGDLDIAISKTSLLKILGTSEEELWSAIEEHLQHKDIDFKIIKNFKQFHISLPLLNANGEQGSGNIQVDFFVGNLNWISNIMSGAPKESNYKAVYRNLLLMAICSSVRWYSGNKCKKYVLDTRDGLKLSNRSVCPKTKRLKRIPGSVDELVTDDPELLVRALFKHKKEWSDINTFEKLCTLYQSDAFQYPEFANEINAEFLRRLKTLKLPVPQELTLNS